MRRRWHGVFLVLSFAETFKTKEVGLGDMEQRIIENFLAFSNYFTSMV